MYFHQKVVRESPESIGSAQITRSDGIRRSKYDSPPDTISFPPDTIRYFQNCMLYFTYEKHISPDTISLTAGYHQFNNKCKTKLMVFGRLVFLRTEGIRRAGYHQFTPDTISLRRIPSVSAGYHPLMALGALARDAPDTISSSNSIIFVPPEWPRVPWSPLTPIGNLQILCVFFSFCIALGTSRKHSNWVQNAPKRIQELKTCPLAFRVAPRPTKPPRIPQEPPKRPKTMVLTTEAADFWHLCMCVCVCACGCLSVVVVAEPPPRDPPPKHICITCALHVVFCSEKC